VIARIGLAAGTDRRQADQADDRRQHEACIDRLAMQGLGDGALDFGQRPGEAGQSPGLQRLTDLGPFGMIAILQSTGSVGAHGLQMGRGIGRKAHLGIGRRHRQRLQPDEIVTIAHDCPWTRGGR